MHDAHYNDMQVNDMCGCTNKCSVLLSKAVDNLEKILVTAAFMHKLKAKKKTEYQESKQKVVQ